MTAAIGIDLGTTNTAVAAVVDGVAVTLEDEKGRRLLPSVVSFHPSGTVLVGDVAKERRLIDPENTVFSVKTLLGRTFDSDEVKNARARFPFKLAAGAKNSTMVMARDVAYALPEISAFVLRRAKTIAEAALGTTVDRAVITVPANFNDLQRASTKIAGKLAGLDVMRILNEPTAAALAYGQSIAKAEKIGVYDLGGGTFDVTLLDLTGNVFEVLATAGDTSLGGDDIDRLIADAMALEVTKRCNFDPRTDPAAYGRLTFVAEEIKKELSTAASVTREIKNIGYGVGGVPITMPFSLTREALEHLVGGLVERTIQVAKQSMEIIGLAPKDFDRVILVGGSTRMPLISRRVEQLFEKPPHMKVNPDEVVALGAAIQAHALSRSKAKRKAPPGDAPPPPASSVPTGRSAPPPQSFALNKTAPTITFSPPPFRSPHVPAGPASPGGAALKPPPVPGLAGDRGARKPPPPLPAGRAPVPPERTSARPPVRSPPVPAPAPDLGAIMAAAPERAIAAEVFARGSAIATSDRAPLLIDVTPLSLRVETVGGYSDVLIAANSPVPCEKSRTFLTASDRQTTVFIRVAQGESSRFAENTPLGELELSGLPAARRGEVSILVAFELDADGILNVRALDKTTGRETKATMRLLGTNTDEGEIAAMAQRQAARQIA